MNPAELSKAALGRARPLGRRERVRLGKGPARAAFVSGSLAGRISQAGECRCQPGLGHSCRDTSGAKVSGTHSPTPQTVQKGAVPPSPCQSSNTCHAWCGRCPRHSPGVEAGPGPTADLRQLAFAGCPGQAHLPALCDNCFLHP